MNARRLGGHHFCLSMHYQFTQCMVDELILILKKMNNTLTQFAVLHIIYNINIPASAPFSYAVCEHFGHTGVH